MSTLAGMNEIPAFYYFALFSPSAHGLFRTSSSADISCAFHIDLSQFGFMPASRYALACCLPLLAVAGEVCFRDVAREAGLQFTLNNDATPEKRLIETMPGGIAIFDYNGDGRPDVFFTNGASGSNFQKDKPQFSNRLFRNEGSLKFRDVTVEAGVNGSGYSMGARLLISTMTATWTWL